MNSDKTSYTQSVHCSCETLIKGEIISKVFTSACNSDSDLQTQLYSYRICLKNSKKIRWTALSRTRNTEFSVTNEQ